MLRLITSTLFLCTTVLTWAQPTLFQPDTLAAGNPWTSRAFPPRDSSFQFAIVADLTGGYRDGVFPEAVQKANAIAPDFVLSVGDLIEGYTMDTAQILRWWTQFDGWVDQLQAPFFYVPGNHDLSNALMTELWEERYGRTYYHFTYQNILFLILNTEDGRSSHISPEQVRYFEQVLADHPNVDWTLLFFHKPLWQEASPGLLAIEDVLQNRNYTVFAGHHHTYLKSKRRGRDYYILGTTGGGSNLAGADFGRFDHLAWVTMRSDGPQVANLALDGILPDDVQTEASLPHARCLLQSTAIRHRAMVEEGPAQRWSTELYFRNRCDRSLELQGRFFQHPALTPSRAHIDTVLAAGSEWVTPLHLTASKDLRGSEQAPLELHWTISAQAEGRQWNQSGIYQIGISPLRTCSAAPAKVVIDGRCDEWGRPEWRTPAELGYYSHSWTGPSDCRMAFQTAANDDRLYFALLVEDDDALYSPFRNSWEQDGAELQLTLPNGKQLRLGFSSGDSTLVDVKNNWPEEARIASRRNEKGFAAEIALPRAALEDLNGGPFERFQLQWIVYDHDGMEDQYKGTKVYWPKPQPGSGTYIIEP